MKLNFKNKSWIFWFVICEIGIVIFDAFLILLAHLQIIPKRLGVFDTYSGINEAFKEGLVFFVLQTIIISIFFLFRNKKINLTKDFYICPVCEVVKANKGKQNKMICNKCKVELVPLTGYFENKKKEQR